ncbi:hypothetical protein PM082_008167 [Marasmius tenuissimus]|nr:hypothetical protein PM082_008167 [Marasmius tenuissimus]
MVYPPRLLLCPAGFAIQSSGRTYPLTYEHYAPVSSRDLTWSIFVLDLRDTCGGDSLAPLAWCAPSPLGTQILGVISFLSLGIGNSLSSYRKDDAKLGVDVMADSA